ncbi:MAG TPA: 50S ribosomal protein L11 methyltransferase [Anaerolineales bacterium]|nr:50S ribosomal protein L11 methyltransferase [Anaerolineales bacterium]HMR99210.1 50S ribosomal protein L11 methyltransferase [Anaerolineales bacterium]HNS61036.1 50S ribosomal protein L11 methyltransferase [Anaerolineales bacterium]
MNWLEVSMTVDGELAESVADVFARFAPNGVMTEQGVKYNDDEDAGTPTGPITVRAYLEMDDQIEETRQKLEESLYYLGMIQPLPTPAYKQIADQNWMEAWKKHYKPIRIGKRLLILPAWMESPEPNRVAIKIDPGMAFGTGTHPTTQLCLELMELLLCHPPEVHRDDVSRSEGSPHDGGDSSLATLAQNDIKVIDVGCGSGILSIAAIKLGAEKVLSVDIDPESIVNSRENAETNGVGEELILGMGSVNEILEGKFEFKSAPVVVANILAPVIVRLFDAGLAELIEVGGAIILSGILQEQKKSVLEAAQAKRLRMTEWRQRGDWVALTMSRG